MKLLVCGGRDWSDWRTMCRVLDELHGRRHVDVVVHGAARGADVMAAAWAQRRGVAVDPWPAQWRAYKVNERWRAGRDRNEQMLRTGPDLVLAFKRGFDVQLRRGGTEHMIGLALRAGVDHLVVS